MSCIFCSIAENNMPVHEMIWTDENHIAFYDADPVTAGHTLVVPRQHEEELSALNNNAHAALFNAVRTVSLLLKEKYNAEKVGMVIEGTSVPHLHVHLIPLQQGESIHELVNRKHTQSG